MLSGTPHERRLVPAPPLVRRLSVGDYIMVAERNLQHHGRRGTIRRVRVVERECLVAFEDGARPAAAYIKTRWLQR